MGIMECALKVMVDALNAAMDKLADVKRLIAGYILCARPRNALFRLA